MDSSGWVRHFEGNRCGRPEPAWDAVSPLPEETAAVLARSLSHFQLGESGDGTVLFRHAARAHPDDDDYATALALFVAEEQEHARLLHRLVERLGGDSVTAHWTDACFRLVRHALGLRLELLTLAAAEIVGSAYYGMLSGRSGDGVVDAVCALMLRDEPVHLEFHRERLDAGGARRRGPVQRVWTWRFRLLTAVTARAAWFDHCGALRAVGVGQAEFLEETARLRARFTRPAPRQRLGVAAPDGAC
jgi:hypothetical protein